MLFSKSIVRVEGCNEAKKSTPPKSTFKICTKSAYQISTSKPNLSGRYARNKFKKIRKISQKTTFLELVGAAMKRKSQDSQNAYLEPLLNLHRKFQLPSSI